MKGPLMRWAVLALLVTLAVTAAPAIAAGRAAKVESAKAAGQGWLGVELQDIDEDMAEAMDLKVDEGALITGVIDGSPADEAGLADGDVVVRFDGQKVRDTADLRRLVRETTPGDKVPVTVVSNGTQRDITVVVGSAGEAPKITRNIQRLDFDKGQKDSGTDVLSLAVPELKFLSRQPRTYLGVAIIDLSGQLGEYFGAANGEGALVREVSPDSPAEQAGLRAGDVIIAMDGTRIKSYEDLTEFLDDARVGDVARVTVLRDHQEQTLEVTLGEPEEEPALGRLRSFRSLPPKAEPLPGTDKNVRVYRYLNSDGPKGTQEEMNRLREEMDSLRKELQKLKDEIRRESR